MEQNKSTVTEEELYKMPLHDIIVITEPPYFKIMRVANGWLYNFYNSEMDNYQNQWFFVTQK